MESEVGLLAGIEPRPGPRLHQERGVVVVVHRAARRLRRGDSIAPLRQPTSESKWEKIEATVWIIRLLGLPWKVFSYLKFRPCNQGLVDIDIHYKMLGYSYEEAAEDYYDYPAATSVPFNMSGKACW